MSESDRSVTKNPFSLEGKTILITGASSGIGKQTCISVAEMGARIIASARNEERLKETLDLLPGEGHTSVQADLTNADDRAKLVEATPQINGFVQSAGISKLIPSQFVTEKLLHKLHATNFDAPVLMTKELLRAKRFLPGASLVFISSVSSLTGAFGHLVYSSSKAALDAASRVYARELAVHGYRSNCINPGMVMTPLLEVAPLTSEEHNELVKHYPLGIGEPTDVANAAIYLLSDASRWITGTTLVLDGGLLCR